MNHRKAILCVGAALLGSGCESKTPTASDAARPERDREADHHEVRFAVDESMLPVPSEPRLALGFKVWRETCRDCHVKGLGGAPRITQRAAWDDRVKRGRTAVYHSALNGVVRTTEEGMPPKGEDYDRPDEAIRAAVDYIMHATYGRDPWEGGSATLNVSEQERKVP